MLFSTLVQAYYNVFGILTIDIRHVIARNDCGVADFGDLIGIFKK